jgi:Leucine-rich repeat (LRR) protein
MFDCELPPTVTDLNWLPKVVNTDEHAPDLILNVQGSKGLKDISVLRTLSRLYKVNLNACPNLRTLQPLAGLPRLHNVYINDTTLADLRPLAKCPALQTLRCARTPFADTMPVLPQLTNLVLGNKCKQQWLDRLHTTAPALTSLDLSVSGGPHDLSHKTTSSLLPLLQCTTLRRLNVRNNASMTPALLVPFVKDPRSVGRFSLQDMVMFGVNPGLVTDAVVHAYAAARCRTETTLGLHGAYTFTHLPSTSALTRCVLQEVYIGGTNVRDLSPLSALVQLRRLECCDDKGNAAPIASVAPLAQCTSLQRLGLRRCNRLTDLAALHRCPQLTTIDVRGCDQVPDAAIRALEAAVKGVPRHVHHDLAARAKPRRYHTLDNGGHPFEVVVAPDRTVTINGTKPEGQVDYEKPMHLWYDRRHPVFKQRVAQVFVGYSPLDATTSFSAGHGPSQDGNSLLLRLKADAHTYLYVGERVYTFEASGEITRYVSPVGNSSVPYPYAVDDRRNRFYLMCERVVCSRLEPTTSDPYALYYARTSANGSKAFATFHQLRKLSLGDQSVGLSYHTNPTKDYELHRKWAIQSRKKQRMPTTHIAILATPASAAAHRTRKASAHPRRNWCVSVLSRLTKRDRCGKWYRSPHTVVSDLLATVHTKSHIQDGDKRIPIVLKKARTGRFDHPNQSFKWHGPPHTPLTHLLTRRYPNPRGGVEAWLAAQREALLAAKPKTTSGPPPRAPKADPVVVDIRLFPSAAAARAYVRSVQGTLVNETDTPSRPHTYTLDALERPLRVAPHPTFKGHSVIDELWAEPPPKRRVLTRKQYVALHEAFGKHVGCAPLKGVTVVRERM